MPAFGLAVHSLNAHAKPVNFGCPAQTIKQGNNCILEQDIVLDAPLDLPANTKFDCKGHRMMPTTAGQPDDPATAGFDPVFSQPQLAIFLNGAHGITVKNCVIDGDFDFGILAINSKASEKAKNDSDTFETQRNKIFNNTINALYVPLHLMASDNFEIKLNHVSYFVRGGVAILVNDNSDGNTIKYNTVTSDLTAARAPVVPGPTGFITTAGAPGGLTSNQVVPVMTAAIFVTQNLGPHSTLFNVVIERRPPLPPDLFQITIPRILKIDENFTADNLVEGNEIFFKSTAFPGSNQNRESGIAAQGSLRTTVINNIVHSPSGIGVRDGATLVRVFPETCTLDPNRYCLTDADCFIEGIDDVSKGVCPIPFPPPLQSVDWFTRDFVIEGNFIEGLFTGGISVAAENVFVSGNTIIGPVRPDGLGGIALRGKFALESGAVITRNIVSNVSIALALDNSFGLPASNFGAQISLNDFTGYTTAVKTTNFNFASELSVDGIGNYWDLTCEQGGFDPAFVDPPNPSIVDSHPFAEPVAAIPEEDLLSACY